MRMCITCGRDIDLHEETQLRHCLREASKSTIYEDLP